MTPSPRIDPPARRIGIILLQVVVLVPLSAALAAKVREVVIRYDDGTEHVVVAAATAPAPDPEPDPEPGPAPNPEGEPPTVKLVEPSAVTTAPGFLLLHAEAADADGSVAKVEFFQGDDRIGACVAPPYLFAWRDVEVGTHAVTARATDDRGNVTTSAVVRVSVKPAPRGKTLVAAKSGDVGRLVGQLAAGDTLVIKPGAYTENVRVARSGTAERPITISAEQAGTVTLQAAAPLLPVFNGDGTSHIIVSGVTFRGGGANSQNNHEATVRAGSYFRVEDCTVEQASGVGITMMEATGTVFLRVTAQDNARAGIGGSKLKGCMVLDCVSRRNNAKGDGNGGGGKFTRADGLLVENHQSYENTGPGIWFDYSNVNCAVRRSHVHHNVDRYEGLKLKVGSAGIFFEISGMVEKTKKQGHLLAENNYVHDNQREGIFAYASRNVIVRDNTLINDPVVLFDDRPEPWLTRDVLVTGNRFKDAGVVADKDTARGHETENIRIDGNTYHDAGTLIEWGSTKCRSLDDARALGFESTGRLGAVEPPDWAK